MLRRWGGMSRGLRPGTDRPGEVPDGYSELRSRLGGLAKAQ